MSSGSDGPTELGIQRFDGICGVDDPADLIGEGVEWNDLAPGPPPALADGRVFAAPVALLEGGERGFADDSVDGPIDVLQRRRNGLAVLPGRLVAVLIPGVFGNGV